jgi:hypothetical protein
MSSYKDKLAKLRNRQRKEVETKGETKGSWASKAYLNLPEGLDIFKPIFEKGKKIIKVIFDIIPYEISTMNHPSSGCIIDEEDDTQGFLPEDFDYKLDIYVHKQIGTDNIAVLCPKMTFQKSENKTANEKKCPICEERTRLMNEGRAWDDDLVQALKAKRRVLYNVIIEDDNDEQVITIMDESFEFLEKELLKEAEIAEEEYVTYSDLEDGRSIKATVSQETFKKAVFWKFSNIQFMEREPFNADIIHEAISLDSLLVIKSYDEIKKIFYEVDEDEQAENENNSEAGDEKKEKAEKKEEKSRKTARRSKKVKEEPEEKEEKVEKKVEHKTTRPKRDRKPREKKSNKEEEKNPCPQDFKFGHDNNLKDKCADCDDIIFDLCADKYDKLVEAGEIKDAK